MESIATTTMPTEILSQEEWMQEFRVGIMTPRHNNNRAKEIMDMWSGPAEENNPFKLFLKWLLPN